VQVLKSQRGDRTCAGLQFGFSATPFMKVPPAMT